MLVKERHKLKVLNKVCVARTVSVSPHLKEKSCPCGWAILPTVYGQILAGVGGRAPLTALPSSHLYLVLITH